MRGPPTKAAFSADGPTKALEGFCKKNGVSPADVTKQTDAKGVGFTCTLGLRKKGGQLLRCVFTQSVHAHAWIGFVCVKVCVWEEAVKQMQGFGMDPQGNEKR